MPENQQTNITENTGVRLTVIGFVFALVAGGIFWAGTLNNKVDTILNELSNIRSTNEKEQVNSKTISEKVIDHEGKLKYIIERIERLERIK